MPAKRKRKAWTPFIVNPDSSGVDRLYVKIATVMNPMVAMIDGLTIGFIGKPGSRGSVTVLEIDVAIAWLKKEISDGGTRKYLDILQLKLAVMEKAKTQFANGEMIPA